MYVCMVIVTCMYCRRASHMHAHLMYPGVAFDELFLDAWAHHIILVA